MMNQARSLLSRNLLNKTPLSTNVGESRDLTGLCHFSSFAGKSAARVFAPYAVFKGKAALSVEPVLPTFMKVDSGDLRIERRGSLMLTFMPAVGERKYDWEKRQRFALSATEVGSLISMGPSDSSEFYHDPSMKSSHFSIFNPVGRSFFNKPGIANPKFLYEERPITGRPVKKSLSIKPHADGSGYFVSLSVNNSILKTTERFTVPVTTAEFAVMKTACSFALPHIMGWNRVTNQGAPTPRGVENSSKADPQLLELEWSR